MEMDFATSFLKGFEEERKIKKSEEIRKNKAKALQDVLKSISTLMEPHAETSTSFPEIPAPTPAPTPPMTLGAPAPGAAPQQYFPTPPAAPTTTTKMVTPDRQEVLRGAMKALGGVDYTPETATALHGLIPDIFKLPEPKVVGGKLVDASGKVVAEGHEKPSFGVSEAGWLTTIYPDGTVQEHVGTRPMQTTVAGINAQSREKVAGIAKLRGDAANEARIRAAQIVAQGGIDRVAAAAKYAKDLAKYKLDRKDAQDPKTVAAYYVQLLQSYQAGDADEADIQMMEYLRPIVEKQGLLGMLMQGGGEMPTRAEAPWIDKPLAPEAPAPEKGWFQKLFGGKEDSAAAPVPDAVRKGAPATPPKKAPAGATSEGPGFSMGTKKFFAPDGHSDADVKLTMDAMQKKLKEGYPLKQLTEHLQKKGWKVQ